MQVLGYFDCGLSLRRIRDRQQDDIASFGCDTVRDAFNGLSSESRVEITSHSFRFARIAAAQENRVASPSTAKCKAASLRPSPAQNPDLMRGFNHNELSDWRSALPF